MELTRDAVEFSAHRGGGVMTPRPTRDRHDRSRRVRPAAPRRVDQAAFGSQSAWCLVRAPSA